MARSVRTNSLPEVPAVATSKDPYSTNDHETDGTPGMAGNDSLAEWELWNETRAKPGVARKRGQPISVITVCFSTASDP